MQKMLLILLLLSAIAGLDDKVSELPTFFGGVAPTSATPNKSDAAKRVRVSEAYGKLPLHFEANRGQTDPQVKFLSRAIGHTLFLTSSEAVLVLSKPAQPANGTVLRMTFVGANSQPRVAGREELPAKVNYFIGNDPTKWRTHVPTYAKVHYEDIYPGIDLVYYGNQRQLEYDFVVAPGADPGRIVLGFPGAGRLEIDARGDLVLRTAVGALRQRKPVIYQEVDGVRRYIPGGYVLRGAHRVAFRVAAYDTSRPLVIDPVLFYSTFLGGSGFDQGAGIAVDALGDAYVTGFTLSANFPTTLGAFQAALGGSFDAFVTKLNPTGSGLVYSTFLGGSGLDLGTGIAVDAAGDAYVTGQTGSANFPTTLGAFQTAFGGSFDAFVTKLNPTGTGLVYSTFLGGSGSDAGFGITVDATGNAYATGRTDSLNFPTTLGAFQAALGGSFDAFVTKLNPTAGLPLVYSTYLGGSGDDDGRGIAVDAAGNAYLTGATNSLNFPTTLGAFQTAFGGSVFDAFMTKLNPTGSGLVYSTYLGGSSVDVGNGITVDAAGNAYLTGLTDSLNFPTTLGAFQAALGGSFDAFVTKLNPTAGLPLVYSTYLGGSGDDGGRGIAVDTLGNAHVTGDTSSSDFPTTSGAFQTAIGSPSVPDAFVAKVNPLGAGLVYSSYLGGSGSDLGFGIALDALPNPNAHVTGRTSSSDFPTTPGVLQPALGGGGDAFVAKITDIVLAPPPVVGKVTGGGSINVVGGIGTFGFIVQRKTTLSPVEGQLQYVNHASGAKVHSVAFTSLVIAGNMATFSGTCTKNGAPCTFTVDVTDNGEPGDMDTFIITINAGPPEGGTLRSGNIQIHQ